MRQHIIGMLETTRDKLRELRLQGFTEQFSRYYLDPAIKRDKLGIRDPRLIEAAKLLQLENRLSAALGDIAPEALAETKRESLRSGGQ